MSSSRRQTPPAYQRRLVATEPGKLLTTYYRKHGLKTVRGLIDRWAPGHENDTPSYAMHVARQIGARLDQELKVDDPLILLQLTRAIITHENGRCAYPVELLRAAVADALGVEWPRTLT